jgi:putative inorganic carbon (HCO3(-)) transporter
LLDVRRKGIIIATLSLIPIVISIILTFSRGAFIGLVVVILLIIYERRLNPFKIFTGLALILLLLIPILPKGYLDRILTLDDAVEDTGVQQEQSLKGRTGEMIAGAQMYLDYPLLGVGPGNFGAHYLSYSFRLGIDNRTVARRTHNLYLEIAAEKGSLGLIVFFVMVLVLFKTVHHARKEALACYRRDFLSWLTATQIGFIGYLATSLFLHEDYSRYAWLLISFIAASSVTTATMRERRRNTPKPLLP